MIGLVHNFSIFYNIIWNLNVKILDAVACDYQIVNNQQKISCRLRIEKKTNSCGIMFKYSHLVEIGLYDKNFLAREEEDLIFRFKKNIKLPRIPVPLYRYRKHIENLTSKKKIMKKYAKKNKNKA